MIFGYDLFDLAISEAPVMLGRTTGPTREVLLNVNRRNIDEITSEAFAGGNKIYTRKIGVHEDRVACRHCFFTGG